MTSSIRAPLRSFAWVSPSAHLNASTMFDLPEPLGPTIATMPPSKRISVRRANVLKPLRMIARRCTAWPGSLPEAQAASSGGLRLLHQLPAHRHHVVEPEVADHLAVGSEGIHAPGLDRERPAVGGDSEPWDAAGVRAGHSAAHEHAFVVRDHLQDLHSAIGESLAHKAVRG